MPAGLITCLHIKILQEAGVPTSTTMTEARGLREGGDKTRHGDIVVLGYHAPGRHLLMDGVVTTAYMNTHDAKGYQDYTWACSQAGGGQGTLRRYDL